MATRKRKKGSGDSMLGWILICVTVFAGGMAGGYALRSYAPLPVAPGTPLSGDGSAGQEIENKELVREAELAAKRVREAEEELQAMRKRLNELEDVQTEAQTNLAEIQIQSLLE